MERRGRFRFVHLCPARNAFLAHFEKRKVSIGTEREGWPGEVEGLKVSLADTEDKLAQITASLHRKADAVHLGMPAFPEIAGRSSTTRPAPEGAP